MTGSVLLLAGLGAWQFISVLSLVSLDAWLTHLKVLLTIGQLLWITQPTNDCEGCVKFKF